MQYHARYIVLAVEHTHSLHPLDLLSATRLATSVNKQVLLASVGNRDEDVSYLKWEWLGVT